MCIIDYLGKKKTLLICNIQTKQALIGKFANESFLEFSWSIC